MHRENGSAAMQRRHCAAVVVVVGNKIIVDYKGFVVYLLLLQQWKPKENMPAKQIGICIHN